MAWLDKLISENSDKYWGEANIDDPTGHPLYQKHSCVAISLHDGDRSWAAMIFGRTLIGLFNTRIEAAKRALW